MDRPIRQENETPRKKTGCGWIYLIDSSEAEYKEIFLRLGKTGGCAAAFLQALAKTASLALRAGVEKKELIRIWKGIGCPLPMWHNSVQILSCPDAVARMLEENIQIKTEEEQHD